MQEDRITAIFDWGSSLYGDFLYDIAYLNFWAPWFPSRAGVDIPQEAQRHYKATGLQVPQFDERLRCYSVHIALDSLAYEAFLGHWEEAELRGRRAIDFAQGG